jgi:hypothetical protein
VTLAVWVVMRYNILSARILVTIVDFCLTCAGFATVCPVEPDMVALSSSDIEEALKLLFSSPLAVLFLRF